ncbi:MAG: hypothetical protein JRN39_05370 [Nitrososphaerota archaeon]|nr:hypothetical protein [Nitrososphaerota archaeon]
MARDPPGPAELEEALCSKGRLRIIRELAVSQDGPLSKYMLERRTGIRSSDLRADLNKLVRIGWVREASGSGRLTRYVLDVEDEALAKTLAFLRGVGYLDRR